MQQPQQIPDYLSLWNSMTITKPQDVVAIARVISHNKDRYEAVVSGTAIPWQFVGCIHNRESSLNWKSHLHNGDPLTARTVRVPAGRPIEGQAPFTWEESAKDALLNIRHLNTIKEWDINNILYQFEAYNGFGVRKYHPEVNSGYLWSFTNHYTKGKYIADGKWSATAIDAQIGCAPLYKVLLENHL